MPLPTVMGLTYGRYIHEHHLTYEKWDKSKVMVDFLARVGGLRPKKSRTPQLYRNSMCKFWLDTRVEDPDAWFESLKGGLVDPERAFSDYLIGLSKTEVGDSYLNIFRAAFIKFSRVMKLGEIDLPKVGQNTRKRNFSPFSREDIAKLLQVSISPRDRALVLLAATSGVRLGEITELKVEDIELDRDQEPYKVKVSDSIAKGQRGYVTFTTQEAIEAIRTLIGQNGLTPQDKLFTKRSRAHFVFKRLVRYAKLDGERCFHSLRKFVKVSLLSSSIPEPIAERLIGHKLGTIAQTYNAFSDEELRKYYQKAIDSSALVFYGRVRREPRLDTSEEVKRQVLAVLEGLGIVFQPETLDRNPINPEIIKEKMGALRER